MKKLFSIIAALLLVSSVMGQGELFDEPVVLYAKQRYGGVLINTHGFGLNFTLANYKGAYNLHTWNWDFVAIKHEKELKYPGQDPTAKGYFYGKQNSFYAIRFGWGTKKTIAEKLRKNGVQLGYSWQIGPELGLLKPIYLEIVHTDPGLGSAGRYTLIERYDPDIHFAENIYGRASGFRGLSEMKAVPGVFAKFAWQFEYSNADEVRRPDFVFE